MINGGSKADPEVIARANEVLERLFALDDAVINARAFRALLQNLHGRDLSIVSGPHVAAITMARAAILRAAVGSVMACLDPTDRRGNRASVGQILEMLRNDVAIVAVFPEAGQAPEPGKAALRKILEAYDGLAKSDLFEQGRRLRNDAIAHVLITAEPTPTVSYETVYKLEDMVEEFVTDLYQVTYRGRPRFLDEVAQLTEHARVFWDTYFRGMRANE